MVEIQDDDLVLVALCKTPRDLEICRLLGWYRIPLASAPKTLRVDWLALFLPAAFGKSAGPFATWLRCAGTSCGGGTSCSSMSRTIPGPANPTTAWTSDRCSRWSGRSRPVAGAGSHFCTRRANDC